MTLLDLLFPKICVGCGGEGSWLCRSCFDSIRVPPFFGCSDCREPTDNARFCVTHAPSHELTGLIAATPFHAGILREAIHTLKYNGVRELAAPLGQLLKDHLTYFSHLDGALVLPIPLHRDRLLQRGFNQAELLAEALAGYKKLAIMTRLESRSTQASLPHESRAQNIRGVFGVYEKARPILAGRTVLLIDDVATTGSTLDEAARLIKKAGATEVWGAVLGKG